MEQYLRKLQHMHHEGGSEHVLRSAKKIVFVAVIGVIAVLIVLIILAVLAFNWLLDRGGEQLQRASDSMTGQVEQLKAPLSLESFIDNGQVDTKKLQETFTSLPTPLQDAWLGQFQTQLNELQNKTGVSDQTIQTLTNLYTTLQQLQG